MPSKLKKAIGAVKDQTSISLAKVVNTNSASLQVAVLKATTHDADPIDERYVQEILRTISSNKLYAAITARVIAKRIGRTKNWVVSLKSLMLVLRIFQDGDPFFPKEVLHAMNRGAKILNLPTFRDDSSSSPHDYTAFVRSFAFYLEERLDCFLTGKLQRRFTFKERQNSHPRSRRVNQQPVRHMKPPMLLDRISYWQRLLDKAIATKPTGAAKTNRLVLVSFYAVVRESFDLYREISDGLGLVLDSFFHLQHQSCVNAFQYCVKASKQFEELSCFYDYCKSLGIGRTSDYPSVQRISEELMDTLQEFLKDQASFPSSGESPSSNSPHLLLLAAPTAKDLSETTEGEPQAGSRCTSLEELMSQTESVGAISPSFSFEHFSELSEKHCHEQEVMYNVTETGSNHSLPIDQGKNVTINFLSFDEWPTVDKTQVQQDSAISYSTNGEKGCSELALVVEAPEQPVQASQNLANDHSFFDNWVQQDHKQEQASQNGANGLSFSNSWLQEDHKQEQASQNGANGLSFSNSWLQEDHKQEQASQNGANGLSFSSSWPQEDHRNEQDSQNGANGLSFSNSWPQEDHRNEQDSQNGANGNLSFSNSWLQEDHRNEQDSQNGANGVSFSNSWPQEDYRNEQDSQNGAKGHSYINEWLQEHQQHEQASHNLANGHLCFDDWLQDEDKNLEHASQIVVANGRSYSDDWLQEDKRKPEEQKQNSASNWSSNGGKEGWELVLVEAATQPAQASQHLANRIEHSMANHLFAQRSILPQRQYNPFLEDETDISASIATITNDKAAAFPDRFSMTPTFQAITPTFFAQSSPNEMPAPTFQALPTSISRNPNGTTASFQDDEYDPFAPWPTMKANNNVSCDGSVDQQNVLLQQELWLQNQNKIIARHIV